MNIDDGYIRSLQKDEQTFDREIRLRREELERLINLPPEERPEYLLATNKAIRKARKRAGRAALRGAER